MLVVRVEYWVAGDPARRTLRGWVAALLRGSGERSEWVVVLTQDERRESRRVPGTVPVAVALAQALAAMGVLIPGPPVDLSISAFPHADSRTESRVSDVVESHLASAQHGLRPPLGAVPGLDPRQPVVRTGARTRALLQDHLTEQQVQDLFAGERDHPAIVRGLRKGDALIGIRHDGSRIYPAHQFAGAGLNPVVVGVNVCLRAGVDPMRAAVWWTTSHPVLGCAPLQLVEHVDQWDRLLRVAATEREQRRQEGHHAGER